MNQIYKKENFIIIPVCENFLIINTEKMFKEGHTHVRNIGIARLLIDLAVDTELPKNPYFVDNLIRISIDKKYINRLEKFREDCVTMNSKDLMKASVYKRHRGAIRQIR